LGRSNFCRRGRFAVARVRPASSAQATARDWAAASRGGLWPRVVALLDMSRFEIDYALMRADKGNHMERRELLDYLAQLIDS
jgi:hypothetical protein